MKLLRRSSLSGLFFLSQVLSLPTYAQEVPKKASSVGTMVARPRSNSEADKVPVELEWEEIPGAKLYELEFQSLNGKGLSTFKSPSHIFKFNFKIGKYRVRSRVADSRKVYGEWSALVEFTVRPGRARIPEKNVITTGVISSKTLTSDVTFHWGEAPGAALFRVKIINDKNVVVKEEIVKGFFYKTPLAAGVYATTLTSISADGIESEPVTLAGKVVIETVQLDRPVIALEEVPDPSDAKVKMQRLPLTNKVPTLRWKGASKVADTVGTLEYRYFFGEEWLPVDKFTSKDAKEVILEKAMKPGRYRINAWAEASGFKKSEVTTYEFVVKPTAY